MITEKESRAGENRPRESETEREWLKVGLFAAASALAGGLAAAWYYRKTLARLREAERENSAADDHAAE